MRKRIKFLTVLLCLVLFASMAIGSGTESEDDANITQDGGGKSTAVSIEEQILFDQNDIKITATEYTTDSIFGDGIKLLIENNSNKTVMVGCNALIVNNYMITDLFASEVAAGKKANETMYLSSSELNAAGIEAVGQIEIYFHIYDSETLDSICDSDCITIQTSEYENMDVTVEDIGIELYNQDGIRIVGKTVDEDSFWGTAIVLYCENTSGKNVGIAVDDMSINGFMMSPYFSTTVYDGKMAISDITILSSDLEENGIETVEDVELKFRIYNADTYQAIVESEAITLSVE